MSLSLGSISDRDIVECLQNCPELDDPLFDENVLNELCLSDELWANLNLPLPAAVDLELSSSNPCGPDKGKPEVLASELFQSSGNEVYHEVPGLTTPPQSPPTLFTSSTTTSPSSASSTSSTSHLAAPSTEAPHATAGLLSPKSFSRSTTLPTSGMSSQQLQPLSTIDVVAPVQTNHVQQQQQQKQLLHPEIQSQQKLGTVSVASLPQFSGSLQVLKSGEVVCLPQVLQRGATPTPAEKVCTKHEVSPVNTGTKRQHPDSNGSDNSTVDMSKLSKKQLRMIKNRESACISRQRKRQYVDNLEARLKEAAQKNSTLLQENSSLRKQVCLLEKENEVLRLSLSRPSSPAQPSSSLSVKKPAAAIVAAAILFLSLSAVFLYPRDQALPNASFLRSRTSTALTSIKSRALLSIEMPNAHLPAASPASSRHHRTRDGGSKVDSTLRSALVPGERMVQLWREKLGLAKDYVLGDGVNRNHESAGIGRACQCPLGASGNDNLKRNLTDINTINKNMMSCFEVKPVDRVVPPHAGVQYTQESKEQNSLTVVSNGHAMHTSEYLFQGAESLYREFKKYIPRNLENFYLLTFKDHVLLQPTTGNFSQLPILSVFIPADPDYNSLLQMDCEVIRTKIISTGRV